MTPQQALRAAALVALHDAHSDGPDTWAVYNLCAALGHSVDPELVQDAVNSHCVMPPDPKEKRRLIRLAGQMRTDAQHIDESNWMGGLTC